MLECQRALFAIPDEVTYLNCSYLSPRLHSVIAAGKQGIEASAHPWEIATQDFFTERETTRQLFAQMINADVSDIAIIPSASYGIASASLNVPVASGDNILLLQDEFPSNVYAWHALTKEKNANIVTVPKPEDGNWTRALLACIDDKTAVVAVVPCHWTDGSFVDLKSISHACKAHCAALVIDATQAMGVLPFSVKQIDADFVITAIYKWMLGPYSLGLMYVNPRHHDGKVFEHNWINRQGSDNFANLVNYQDQFAKGARRFDVGESSNFILLPMAIAAMRQILAWQVEAIAERLAFLTDHIGERAADLGLRVRDRSLRAGHMIGLRFSNIAGSELLAELNKQSIYVSLRGDSIRVSPHVYNSMEDIHKLFSVLERFV